MGAKAGFITIIGNFIIGAVLFLFDPDFLIAGGETLFFFNCICNTPLRSSSPLVTRNVNFFFEGV